MIGSSPTLEVVGSDYTVYIYIYITTKKIIESNIFKILKSIATGLTHKYFILITFFEMSLKLTLNINLQFNITNI